MALLADALRVRAPEDLGHVRGSIALIAADHAREDHLGHALAVVHLAELAVAHIARAALALGQLAAEVLHEEPVPAEPAVGEVPELPEPIEGSGELVHGSLDPLHLGLLGAALHDPLPALEVRSAVEHEALGGEPVPPGATGLLAVLLDALGQARVDDEADVRSVDPHPEGDGGHHHVEALPEESLLDPRALRGVEAGVVGHGSNARARELPGELLGVLAADAVDDARLVGVAADNLHDLLEEVEPGDDSVGEVRPVEVAHDPHGILQPELLLDVAPDPGGRGRREGDDGDLGAARSELAELAVLRAEVMPPVADAVGLVHGDGAEARALELPVEALHGEPLGRDEQDVQLAAVEGASNSRALIVIKGAAQHRRADAVGEEPVELVFHQRDERADHQGQPGANQGRRLVAEALAAARGEDHEDVSPLERGAHGLVLVGAQAGEAPGLVHALQELVHGRVDVLHWPRGNEGLRSAGVGQEPAVVVVPGRAAAGGGRGRRVVSFEQACDLVGRGLGLRRGPLQLPGARAPEACVVAGASHRFPLLHGYPTLTGTDPNASRWRFKTIRAEVSWLRSIRSRGASLRRAESPPYEPRWRGSWRRRAPRLPGACASHSRRSARTAGMRPAG